MVIYKKNPKIGWLDVQISCLEILFFRGPDEEKEEEEGEEDEAVMEVWNVKVL